MTVIEKQFVEFMASYGNYDTYIIGYSGGLDSTVLAHLFLKFFKEKTVLFHMNHGISDFANEWQKHCENYAEHNGCKIHCYNVNLKDVSNLEEEARSARINAVSSLKDIYGPKSIYVTAHHKNDNIETFLLNLFRGSGIDGLSSLHPNNQISLKPLLPHEKENLGHYAVEVGLVWVEDESNQLSIQDRNFIRKEILPLIKERWPNVDNAITTSITHIQEAKDYIKETVIDNTDVLSECMPYSYFLEEKEYKRNILLREWIKAHSGRYPSKKFVDVFNSANIERIAEKGGVIFENNIFVITAWKGNVYYIKNDRSQYMVKNKRRFFNVSGFVVEREYNKTETVLFKGRKTSLETIFREKNIQPFLRKWYKMYYYNGELISLGGIFNNERFLNKK